MAKKISILEIDEILRPQVMGVSLTSITHAAEKLGLEGKGYKITIDELQNLNRPAILHWDKNHFVVLYKISKDKQAFWIADPGKYCKKFTIDEFNAHWISVNVGDNVGGIAIFLKPGLDFKETTNQKKTGYIFFRSFINFDRTLNFSTKVSILVLKPFMQLNMERMEHTPEDLLSWQQNQIFADDIRDIAARPGNDTAQALVKILNKKLGGNKREHVAIKKDLGAVVTLSIPTAIYSRPIIMEICTAFGWNKLSETIDDYKTILTMCRTQYDMPIDNKVPLIYISGWKGAGKESSTYKWLAHHFKNIDCYAAGGQTDVWQMIRDMEEICNESYGKSDVSPIIIGNSYGGFIASLLGGTQVLINPALFPSETLPQIAELSAEEIENFLHYENNRQGTSDRVYAICTEGDELIPDHRTEVVSTNAPIMIPGGAHRMTDEQRDRYLLPLLAELVRPTYHIVKLSCDSLESLKKGDCCEHVSRRFPTAFTSKQDAEEYLQWHIKRNHDKDVRPVIGYFIQEIYGDNMHKVYRQWSYTPEGQPLAEAYINSTVQFDGREPQTLPFRRGDYVIAYCYGDLILGLIFGEPCTPAEVEKMKQRAQSRTRDGEVSYFRLDSSDDSYVVDFIDEDHGHPSVAQVFPLPFDVSEIPDEVKNALHWADKDK